MRIAVVTGASSGMGRDFAIAIDKQYELDEIWVIAHAMKDLRKKKPVSILGLPVRMQVRLVKHLPVSLVMKTWCKQQGK